MINAKPQTIIRHVSICCEHSDDAYTCVEDYVINGFCSNEPAVEYGPPATENTVRLTPNP